MTLTRKQVKEALQTVPIDQVLMVPNELTPKQREFARLVASGEKGAVAYRKTYNSHAKKKTQGDAASRLKRDVRVAAEIEAYRLANEAAKYRTPQQLRELVIHSLVQVVIDPEAKHAQKVQAAKVLGTVTEVAAFTERREVTHIKSADDAKAAIMAKLRALMNSQAIDVTAKDADDLARELTPPVSDSAAEPGSTPTPPNGVWSPSNPMHSVLHTQNPSNSIDPPPPHEITLDGQDSSTGNTPLSDLEREIRGGT